MHIVETEYMRQKFTMSATTKPIKDKIPAQAYLLHTICFLDTGSDTAYFPISIARHKLLGR